jgi:hypothetical protein
VLYGSTTIAQDSTDSWGVWDQLEPTAAGPALPKLSIPGLTEWYRSLSQVAANAPVGPVVPVTPIAPAEVLATQICAGGSICGFGRATPSNEKPAQFVYSLVVTPTTLPDLVRERSAALATESIPKFAFPVAITIQSKVLGEGGPLLAADSGLLTRNGSNYAGNNAPNFYNIGPSTEGARTQYENGQPVAGWFNSAVGSYVMGGEGVRPSMQIEVSRGVVGITTSDADMGSLRMNKATANYSGYDLNGLNGGAPNVKLSVNFGTGIFTGSINGGTDGAGVTPTATNRGTQLSGPVGVNIVKGVITGANFMSTALSANDGRIGAGSVVQGAFFGPNAAVASGAVNINKTSDSGAYTNANHVTVFQTVRDTPPNSPK